jgi:hypothetical protein
MLVRSRGQGYIHLGNKVGGRETDFGGFSWSYCLRRRILCLYWFCPWFRRLEEIREAYATFAEPKPDETMAY